MRLFALVPRSKGPRRVRHHVADSVDVIDGELVFHGDRDMRSAAFAIMSPASNAPNAMFVDRFSWDGEFAGDTWHPSLAEAKEQALFEFGVKETDWRPIPDAIQDPVQFVLIENR